MAERILVVDDEEDMRELYQRALRTEGYEVEMAENSAQALERIKSNPFNCIIADIRMPGMDGITLLETAKKIRPETDVIIATGYPATDTAVRALKYDAFDYIIKPFTIEELILTVQRCLEKQKLAEENIGLKKIAALYEVSKAISSTTELKDLLNLILDSVIAVTEGEWGTVVLLEKENQPLRLEAVRGLSLDLNHLAEDEIILKYSKKAIEKKEAILWFPGWGSDEVTAELEKLSIKSALFVPLKVQDEVIGSINLFKIESDKSFSKSDQDLLTIFAEQAATVIRDAKLHQILQEKLKELESAYEKLRLTQEQLIQAEKLSAVGQLAAGVAHEINNPLTIILSYIQVLQRKIMSEDPSYRYLQIMQEEVDRTTKIVQGLLDFARQSKPELKPLNINQVILDTLAICEHQLYQPSHPIKVIKEFSEDFLPKVFADKNQMQQVFVNLIINAVQAMPKGGELAIKTYLRKKTESEPAEVIIEVSDTGCGISPENLKRIFEPFFTTKDTGKGTGLGLSLVYGIIQRHQGEINVESEEGVGTKFIISLPAIRGINDDSSNLNS